jgi:hypothetical protein
LPRAPVAGTLPAPALPGTGPTSTLSGVMVELEVDELRMRSAPAPVSTIRAPAVSRRSWMIGKPLSSTVMAITAWIALSSAVPGEKNDRLPLREKSTRGKEPGMLLPRTLRS